MKVWLTSMCQSGQVENITEMVEPVLSYLDGIVWVLNDCPDDDPGAKYLETVRGEGKIVHRPWSRGRHSHCMNDTLFCGPIEEGDFVLWADHLERPRPEFVSRIKTEIGPMMVDADLDIVAFYQKPYLIKYRETMEYRGSPHWMLIGHNGRAIEWSKIEPDETKVRFNARPLKRMDPLGFVLHYAKYYLYSAGSNTCALGIEQYAAPGESHDQAYARREQLRLSFRWEMKKRGLPTTMEALKALLTGPLDEVLRGYLTKEKILSDLYHYYQGRTDMKDTHYPSDAILIP